MLRRQNNRIITAGSWLMLDVNTTTGAFMLRRPFPLDAVLGGTDDVIDALQRVQNEVESTGKGLFFEIGKRFPDMMLFSNANRSEISWNVHGSSFSCRMGGFFKQSCRTEEDLEVLNKIAKRFSVQVVSK